MPVNNRREGIIPITHTEIMLVLAVVLLLLLVASNTNWRARFAQAEENIASLVAREEMSPETLAEQQRQLDLGREVKDALVRAGVAPSEDQAALTPEDITAIEKLVEDNNHIDQALAEVEATINSARSEIESQDEHQSDVASRAQRIERLAANARIGEMVRRTMEGANQDVVNESASIEELERRVRRLLGDAAAESAVTGDAGEGDLVGFNPCWPGDAARDNRRYYFAYDLTYADNWYQIEPHIDWNQRIPVIVAALSGELAILHDYPTEAVSPEALVSFGRSVERALAPLREIDSGNDYPQRLPSRSYHKRRSANERGGVHCRKCRPLPSHSHNRPEQRGRLTSSSGGWTASVSCARSLASARPTCRTLSGPREEFSELKSRVEPPTDAQRKQMAFLLKTTGSVMTGELHSGQQAELLNRDLEAKHSPQPSPWFELAPFHRMRGGLVACVPAAIEVERELNRIGF